MSPTRFRQCLDLLGWSQRALAEILDRPEGTVRQMARGALPIPNDVAEWLEIRALHAEQNPPPKGR